MRSRPLHEQLNDDDLDPIPVLVLWLIACVALVLIGLAIAWRA